VALHHSAQLGDLEPNTLYAYRVGGGEVWSEWFHHRTAGREPAPFSFLYFGDAQNDIRSLWSRACAGHSRRRRPRAS
jgi:phosphodiesterase/alkaline phosphatase D-like protein